MMLPPNVVNHTLERRKPERTEKDRSKMKGLTRFATSSVGAKVMMAISGILVLGFLVVHMAGNLQMHISADAMNTYAYNLKHKLLPLVWATRIGLLGLIGVHIWAAYRVTTLNLDARPVGYSSPKYNASTYASRTMRWSGVILFAFIVYHILHFTAGVTNPEHFAMHTPDKMHDVYRMVVLGFQQPFVALFYIIAQVLLAMHLSHGISSFFQTMGWNNTSYQNLIKRVGPAISVVLCLGFISVPLGVLLGIIK
ncbi:MAG TPA: hypothetical protein DCE42_23105 [Myxococcales bacterium]|nr:hypothetical protein [Deltaproteobacteria bacterium]HAA57675.1 hypothetical protein [Myxococcales bacterium]|tara:strand:+ start:19926 stop:20684 length:759 start_codon:yes stop_codon:yes gene_type:complete